MEGGSRPNIPCLTNRAVEAKRQAQQKACPQHCQNHPQYRHGAAAAMAACIMRDLKSWVLWREQAGPRCTRVDRVGGDERHTLIWGDERRYRNPGTKSPSGPHTLRPLHRDA